MLKNHYINSCKTPKRKQKNTCKKARLQSTVNQLVMKWCKKRCLIALQKGVNKALKGHLLQA